MTDTVSDACDARFHLASLAMQMRASAWRTCPPARIQRQRTKGWTMPPGAVYVGRPTVYGNPFEVGASVQVRQEPKGDIWWRHIESAATGLDCSRMEVDQARAVLLYMTFVDRLVTPEQIQALRGLDLACWCPLDQPCHADVLLELARL